MQGLDFWRPRRGGGHLRFAISLTAGGDGFSAGAGTGFAEAAVAGLRGDATAFFPVVGCANITPKATNSA